MTSGRRNQELSRYLIRFVLFGTLAVLCALAVADGAFFLAALSGGSAVFTGSRLLDRKGNRRRELQRWARENARELGRVARENRIAAPQMKRLEGLQGGCSRAGSYCQRDTGRCWTRTSSPSWARWRALRVWRDGGLL